MRRRIGLYYVAVLMVGVLSGIGWAADVLPTQHAIDAMRAKLPQAKLHMVGQRVTRVFGQPLARGATPKLSAEQFRLSHSPVFGVPPDDLTPVGIGKADPVTQPMMHDRDTGSHKFTLVRYTQRRNGIPVFRADLRLLVRNERDFPVVLAVSSLRALGKFVPGVASAQIDPASKAATGMETFTEPEKVIWAGVNDVEAEPVLALMFDGEKGSMVTRDYERWLFVVDPGTGKILYKESRIIFEDVYGTISGYATEGDGAEHCEEEVLTPMPHAYVAIEGGNSTDADTNGEFVIPNAGTSAVTVKSPIRGQNFHVYNDTGEDEELTTLVTPPGPADFEHNESNTEAVRAQVNAYVEANEVRNLVIYHNPAYPSVSTETDFPVYVNRTDGYCPANAWYSSLPQSINFCSAASPYPNTAWSGVIHHEYGHRLVNAAGSGQGQYGEGMGDVMGLLLSDDPGCGGYGFFGPCSMSLRSADNTLQYPCVDDGSPHYCGQLLSGCVWDTRNALVVTEPVAYLDILSNLAINAMLLHTGSQITPQITIDFLTLDDDDANIGNGTPHRDEICAGFGAHNMDCPPLDIGMRVTPEEGFISEGPIGGPFAPNNKIYTLKNLGPNPINYAVSRTQDWLSITNDSGSLEVDEIVEVTVSINTDANSLPGGLFYDDVVTFTNTTNDEGNTTREVSLGVGYQPAYTWSLDTDPGWSTEGDWAFGKPTGDGGEYGGADPTSGYTGDNVYGYNLNGDYPSNPLWPYVPWEEHLTSKAIDCTGLSQVSLRFWRWLGVEHPDWDHAYVRVSNDGTNYTTVWENTTEVTDFAWTPVEYDISSVADNQSTVFLRWTMGDTDQYWTYCGWNIDDIEIYAFGGEETCTFDSDCNDGLFCNGTETCVDGTCQAGTPPNCDDGVGCTDDSCDEGTDTCTYTPNDASCDDGLYCNGVETCDQGTDCQSGTDPCPGKGCDEDDDICFDIVCNDDGTCDAGEDCNNCSSDCISGSSGGGGSCENDCFKSVCDGVCHPVKDSPNCPDCATSYCCGDGECEGDEYAFNCAVDCGAPPVCGDGTCDPGEDPCNCVADCDPPPGSETDCTDGIDNDCDQLIDTADPDCNCLPKGDLCTSDNQCCSKKCKGKAGSKTCR
jgi:hypothetical protein